MRVLVESYVNEGIDYGNDVIPPKIFFPRLSCATSLRSKRFQSSYSAKVGAGAKKKWKGEGKGRRGNACPQTPSFLFLLSSQFSGRTRAETLATQASARHLHYCKKINRH